MALALAMGVIVTYLPPGAIDKYHLAYWRPLAIGEFLIYWFAHRKEYIGSQKAA